MVKQASRNSSAADAEMSRRKQAKPRSLLDIVMPEDAQNTEDVAATDPLANPPVSLLSDHNENTSHTQPAYDSPKIELSPPPIDPVTSVSAVTVAASNHPPPGVFHCQVCSREFDSLARFMDHRNDGCVSSENESDLSTESQACESSPNSSHLSVCCPLSPDSTPTDRSAFSTGPSDDYTYTCQFCEKAFSKVEHLRCHEQSSHSDKLPHKCHVCSRQFRHKRSRDRHVKLHVGDRKYRCLHCHIAFSRSDHLKLHLKSHVTSSSENGDGYHHAIRATVGRCSPSGSTRQVFSCGQCFENFPELAEMDNHVCVQQTSPETSAGNRSTIATDADRQLTENGNDRMPRSCPLCSKSFNDVERFYRHVTSHDLDGKVSVLMDDQRDVTVMDDDASLSGRGDRRSYSCPICKLEFDAADLLETHIQLAHVGSNDHLFSCEFCELAFSSAHWLSEHVSDCHRDLVASHGSQPTSPECHPVLAGTAMSNSANVVFCSQCSVAFPDIYSLGPHIQRVHGFGTSGSREMSPPALKKRPAINASPASSVMYHPYKDAKKKKKTAPGQQSYYSAALAKMSGYQTSENHHDAEPTTIERSPYSCSECDTTFAHQDELESHASTHYLVAVNEYGCTSCRKLFAKPDELQKHLMDIHAHHLYRCSLCKEVFDSKVNIQVHFAIEHSNECKLYRCARCHSSVFRSEMEWRLHVKVHHLGISDPYQCYLCRDSFCRQSELDAHLAAEHKKQFVCPVCEDEAFHVEYLLDKHMQERHTVEVSPASTSPQFLKVNSGVRNVSSTISCVSPSAGTLKLMSIDRRSVTEQASQKAPQLYNCDNCDLKFSEDTALQQHRVNSHNVNCENDFVTVLKQEKASPKALNHSRERHHSICRTWSKLSRSPPDDGRINHQCVQCNKSMKTRADLEKHVKTHHSVHTQHQHHTGSASQKCNICDEVFANANVLAAHKLTHCKVAHGSACVVCKSAITCEDQFYSHVQQHSAHADNMQCIVCRQTLVSLLELQMHGKHHFQSGVVTPHARFYTCCLCAKTFDTKENLVSKLTSSGSECHVCKPCFHGETPVTLTLPTTDHGRCVVCGIVCETAAQLNEHASQHQKTYQCIKCQQTFASEYEIQLHVATHVMHEGNVHPCHLCDRLCESPAKLQCHLIRHTFAGTDMTCSVCGATFSEASAIQLHVLEHGIGVRPYSCAECQQKFFFSAELQNHFYSHQSQRNQLSGNGLSSTQKIHANSDHQVVADIPCSLCPETFGSTVDVDHHFLATHSNGESVRVKLESTDHRHEAASNGDVSFTGKLHRCPECDKEFEVARHLTVHLRSCHNIGKPFDCNVCGKRFSRKDNCKAHMKCHHGGLRCPVCDKTFNRQMSLEDHMTIHFKLPSSSAGPYTCEICGETFAYSKYLQSHLVTAHNESGATCNVCSAVFSCGAQLKDHMHNDHGRDVKTDPMVTQAENGSPEQCITDNGDKYIGSNGKLQQESDVEQMGINNNTAINMNVQTEQLTVM